MCAQCQFAHHMHDQFKLYFVGLLPASIVHHRFLSALATAQDEIVDLTNTDRFKRSAVYAMWTELFSAVEERIQVLYDWNSDGEARSVKACDNLQCTEIDVKSAFRRCSGCQSFYYCSKTCQIADWREGGHRETCGSYGTLFLSEKNKDDFGTRQRSFLRALVHHDYTNAKPTLLSKHALFMNAFPGKPFVTVYDYTKGAVNIDLKSHASLRASETIFGGAEWESILSRAAASGGRMGVDVIVTSQPNRPRCFVIPLRTNSSVVHDRLRHLAAELPADRATWDTEQVFAKLTPLVSGEDPDVMEVH